MIHPRGDGKYLAKSWHEDRQRAIREIDEFTVDQIAFLEVGNEPGPLGHLDALDRNCMVPRSDRRDYDIRHLPTCGD